MLRYISFQETTSCVEKAVPVCKSKPVTKCTTVSEIFNHISEKNEKTGKDQIKMERIRQVLWEELSWDKLKSKPSAQR